MHMARHKLGKRIDHRNDGFLKVTVFHACGTPKRASSGHVAASGGGFGAVNRHDEVAFLQTNVEQKRPQIMAQ
jgi:hypothetical protein